MIKALFSTKTKVAFICSALTLLQACATTTPSNDVMAAYNDSGSIVVKPYTRTIFSSNDF